MGTSCWASLPTLVHPVVFLIGEVTVIVCVLGFSSPSSLGVRLGCLIPLTTCFYGVIATAPAALRMAWGGLVCGVSGFCLFHYLDVALIRRWQFAHDAQEVGSRRNWTNQKRDESKRNDGPVQAISTGPSMPYRTRIVSGLHTLSSFRKIGSSLEVKNVPPFPNNAPPAVRDFVLASAGPLLLSGLVLDLSSLSAPPELGATPFAPEKVPLLLSVLNGTMTKDDLVTRGVGTVAHWVLTYCYLRFCYDTCSLLLVALKLCPPALCRPLFGPPSDMFTLRGFWGSTWHQLARDPCGQPASFIAHEVLRLPRQANNLVSRYSKVLLVFFLSGLVHMAADLAAGIAHDETAVLHFMLLQVLGICAEDATRSFFGDTKVTEMPRAPEQWQRILGYSWVCIWLFWTTPVWFYPAARHHDGSPLLPFSIVGHLLGARD